MWKTVHGIASFSVFRVSVLQTDGSYRNRVGRVAMILTSPMKQAAYSNVYTLPAAANSTEAEWASVAGGLEFALEKGEDVIGIENDNQGVIMTILTPAYEPKQKYAVYYRNLIYKYASCTNWTGIRWIPRVQNRADDLFRTGEYADR